MSKKFTKLIILLWTVFTVSYAQAQDVGIVINEFSNGVAGDSLEYVELLVVGCPGRGVYAGNNPDLIGPDFNFVDLRGWILDDNNGQLSNGAATGITNGHIRFANHPTWEKVPVGSIIVIYNTRRFALQATTPWGSDDPQDGIINNKVYILGIHAKDSLGTAPLLEICNTNPNAGDNTYTGCTYAPTDTNSWRNAIELRDLGDAMQVRKPDGTFFHGISYGDINGQPLAANPVGTQSVNFAGTSGAARVFFFDNIPSSNYRLTASYTASTDLTTADGDASDQTPAVQNNTANGSYIGNFKDPTNGGPDQELCDLFTPMAARGVSSRWTTTAMWEFTPTGTWTVYSTPPGVNAIDVTFQFTTQPTSGVSVPSEGQYSFVWTNDTYTPSCVDADTVNVLFVSNPISNAGPDVIVCGPVGNLDAVPNLALGGKWEFVPDSLTQPVPTIFDIRDPKTLINAAVVNGAPVFGRYRVRWRVGAIGCEAVDVMNIDFIPDDAVASAGADKPVCGLTTGLAATGIPGRWSVAESPIGSTTTFGNSLATNSNVTVSLAGTYKFVWTIGITPCLKADTVKVDFFNIPVAAAGRDTTVCGNVYGLQGNTLGGTTGQWTQVGGTTLTNPFANASNPNTTVTVPNSGGTYSFRWSLTTTGPVACNAQDDVTVKFIPLPNVIEGLLTADSLAGPDLGYCGLGGGTDAILPIDTDPTTTISGLWEYVGSNPVGLPNPTILTPTNPNTGITAIQGGTYTFRWTVTVQVTGQGGTIISCPQSGEIDILFIDVPGGPNIAAINAGTDQAQVCGITPNHTTTLAGSAVPINYTGTWSVSNNPTDKPTGSTTVFANPVSPNTDVTVNLPGTYKFVWSNSTTVTATDGKQYSCGVSDTVAVTFVAIPDANPGKDTLVCALNYLLNANLPIGAIGNTPTPTTGVWTVVPGAPGTVTFSPNATTPNATATVDVEGEYNLIWTLSLGTCTDDDTLTVDFVIPPTPNAGLNQVRCEFTTTLAANSTATQLAGTTGAWSIVSQPTGGGATNASFSNINDPLATFTVASKVAGNYNLRWTFTRTYDGLSVCPVFDDVTIQFDPTPPANAGTDQIAVCATPGTTVLGATATANSTGAWSLLSTVPNGLTVNFGDVTNSQIANPNATAIFSAAGTYNLVWRVQGNQDASCFNTDTVRIVVTPPLFTTITDVAPLCGLTTSLVATTTPTNLQTGQWTASPTTGVVFTSATTPNTSVTVPGTGIYTFTWTTGNGVCTATDNTVVDFSTPIVGASVTPEDQALYFGKTTTATASVTSPSTVNYTWSVVSGTANSIAIATINSPTPTFNPTEDSEYEVTIRSGNSCVETRRIKIRVIREIYVPNVFTPNGDGLYDTWIIRELDGFTNASVKVFNRWGDLVFENKGAYTKPWDGTYNGKPVGTATFYYVIDKGENVPAPDKREIKGSVTVTY